MREPKPITIADVLPELQKSSAEQNNISQVGRFSEVLDARSQGEFLEDHLPGAISTPVLDDAERVAVGTLYKQSSAFDAKKIGAAYVARNIANLLEHRFQDKPKDWSPLVYCWRGGNRSGALATILARVGWPVYLLEGGYRDYRRAILSSFDTLPQQFQYRVIAGPTGSGKSQILQALAAKGQQVLDLEDLAKHKGSVLGGLVGQPQPTQKMFDTLVAEKLRRFDQQRPVFIESESKKVGSCQVPDQLISTMRNSPCIVVEASTETRVALLLGEYQHFTTDQTHLFKQLDCLTDLHGKKVITDWKALATAMQWEEFVEATLTQHYDPAYYRSMDRNYKLLPSAITVNLKGATSKEVNSAADQIINSSASLPF
jgi:tRNA 2-selenouridine synthase